MCAALEPTDAERRIVNEFCQLLEKSKQLFNGIRDLPQHTTKQWQGYFGRTFDVYTRLWKFQQLHRHILDVHYGLKRWQIGEIASKIGQLYYHYYLRTSETSYLLETFSFYSAVRSRAYYSKASKDESFRADLTVKKLRYYARFIVVCLLLKKVKLVRELIRELSRHVEEYVNTCDPDDKWEWSLILTEIKSFVEADNIVNIVDVDNSTVILSHRLTPYNTPPIEKGVAQCCSLQEVLIVGNQTNQVKCTELSLDMYWALQALEREPHDDPAAQLPPPTHSHDQSPAPGGRYPHDDTFQRAAGKENPHKYLLYKPTFAQLMLFLSSGYRELPPYGALLLYISADGCFEQNAKRPGSHLYDMGGVAMNSRREGDMGPETAQFMGAGSMDEPTPPVALHQNMMHMHASTSNAMPNMGPGAGMLGNQNAQLHAQYANRKKPGIPSLREIHCLYPGDLYPLLRKPTFVIIDSNNSSAFLGIKNLFGQPCITLTSPVDLPPYLQEQPRRGSLFTLFLHSPLTAFCYICNLAEIPLQLWDRCQAHIDKFVTDAGRLLVRSATLDRGYLDFYGDDFLRLLLLRFIFCACTLRMHRSFRGNAAFHPHCHPPISESEVVLNVNLTRLVLDLACILDVLRAFRDTEETVC